MNRMTFVLVLGLMTLTLGVLGVSGVEALNCGDTLGPGGSFTLTADVGPCTTPAGLFVAGPVTVDLNGHAVTCYTNGGGNIGIDIQGVRAVVKNGLVEGCNTGLQIEGNTSQVRNVVANHNNGQGFLVIGSGHNTLANNAALNNGFSGFSVPFNSNSNTFTGNSAAGNGVYGFEVASSHNSFTRNTAADNVSNGFQATGGSNSFTGNMAVGNFTGFAIDSAHDILRTNTATRNIFGFLLEPGSSGNTLGTNEAYGNGDSGIVVKTGSTHNSISDNVALGNSTPDLADDNINCDSNVWFHNVFNSSSAPCVH